MNRSALVAFVVWVVGCGSPERSQPPNIKTITSPGGLVALAAAGGVRLADDGRAGLRFAPAARGRGAEVDLAVVAWGRADELRPGGGVAVAEGDGILIEHGGLTERWERAPGGLWHGFSMLERPVGEGDLRIEVSSSAGVVESGADLRLVPERGPRLRYEGIVAWDATGVELPSSLEATDLGFCLRVEDGEATYPLTIDPWVSWDGWAPAGAQGAAHLGSTVAGLGDLNGDGYGDIGVGIPDLDDQGADRGAVWVFLGGADGPGNQPDLVLPGAAAGSRLGTCLGGAGDVNGDGYSDLVAGGTYGAAVNRAQLWLGGPQGPSASPSWTYLDPAGYTGLGADCGSAGDVNGDGYADVAVGAPYADILATDGGAVFVFHGSPTGLPSAPSWSASGAAGHNLGLRLSPAGDVDGDGFSDLIAGRPGAASTAGPFGIWMGSSGGLSALPAWGNFPWWGGGGDVAGLGDVDADGRSDIVFAGPAPYVVSGAPSPPTVISATNAASAPYFAAAGDLNGDARPDMLTGDGNSSVTVLFAGIYGYESGYPSYWGPYSVVTMVQGGSGFGSVLSAAGDVDGDGFGDFLVGAPYYDATATDGGAAFLYYGAGEAMNSTVRQSIGVGEVGLGYSIDRAGDVNGDGYDDLVAGNPLRPGAERLRLFQGSANGLVLIPQSTIGSPAPNEDLGFGSWVAGASDLDQDGYDDVVVTAPAWSNGQSHEGAAFVYAGSPSGLGSAPTWQWESGAAWTALAEAGPAGDVNADGFPDLVAAGGSNSGAPAGWLFLGGEGGLATEPARTWSPSIPEGWQNAHVTAAGDVNCDGLDDILVAWPRANVVGLDSGSAAIYLGDAADPGAILGWADAGGAAYRYFGNVSVAYSSDGDACGDWALGRGAGAGRFRLGSSTMSLGSGFDTASNEGHWSSIRAGDWDGDGWGDVAIANEPGSPGRSRMFRGITGTAVSEVGSWSAYAPEVLRSLATGDWNGDGFDDLTIGGWADIAENTQIQTWLGNWGEAEGPHAAPPAFRLRSPQGGPPIPAGGRSTAWDGVEVHGNGRSPYGRGPVGVQAQIAPAGGSWDDAVSATSSWQESPATPGSVSVQVGIDGLANDSAYQWRARVVLPDTSGFPQTWGPWTYGGLPTVRRGAHFRTAAFADADGDGSPDSEDCGALDPAVHPGAVEIPGDTVDEDCDGALLCLLDADDDGAVPPLAPAVASSDLDCEDPEEGLSLDPEDCDDLDADVGPAAEELVASGVDEDCDGAESCRVDADGDGHPAPASTLPSVDLDCLDGAENDGLAIDDCDDTTAEIVPGGAELVGTGVDEDCDGYETCYADADGDGYRPDSSTVVISIDPDCDDVGEGSAPQPLGDCDDATATVHPGAPEVVGSGGDQDCDGLEHCFVDGDGDGYRTIASAILPSSDADCVDAGEALPSHPATDCNDGNPNQNPGQVEVPGDEIDTNCDGAETCWSDIDADGASADVPRPSIDLDCIDPGEASAAATAGDCDDNDPTVRPGRAEIPADSVDQDCDGIDGAWCYSDGDADGWGVGAPVADADGSCDDDALQVSTGGDCADGNPARNPGMSEIVGDGVDADCDGGEICYRDDDGDGFRPLASNVTSISADADCSDLGEALAAAALGDCDDGDPAVRPGATEIAADGIDQDCDGGDLALCHLDLDGDGFGSFVTAVDPDGSCTGSGQAPSFSDCDDADASVHPGTTEGLGDEVDSDCDGVEWCLPDSDSDGFRPIGSVAPVLSADSDCGDAGEGALSEPASDCDDADPLRSPGVTELPADGIDGNCDGVESCFPDFDGDGYRPIGAILLPGDDLDCDDLGEAPPALPAGDCDDGVAAVHPGAQEQVGDGVDQDCDGGELCPADGDGDGFPEAEATVVSFDLDCVDGGEGDVGVPPDCDDLSPSVYPGAPEWEDDGRDQDCDGHDGGGLCTQDGDGDGWVACLECDDSDSAVHPMARELCDGLDTDCDPNTPEPFDDDPDQDGVTACDGDCGPWDPWVGPGAPEGCDGLDNDCSGDPSPAEFDADGDADRPWPCGNDCDDGDPLVFFGASESATGPDRNCDGVVGAIDIDGDLWSLAEGDCDDADPSVAPGVTEVCDGVDNDCNGTLGEGEAEDEDHDGARRCADCDDLDPRRHPGAVESCDGLDDDCDGLWTLRSEVDHDGDGILPCAGDCADDDPLVRPGAVESCGDGVDNDCDGTTDIDSDLDLDGARTCSGGDCDDTRADINPGAAEFCDGLDGDCDGIVDGGLDQDGDGHTPCAGDCDDGNPLVFVGAPALCADPGDEDCFPSTLEHGDADGDGFTACDDPADCDEGAPQIRPNQVEHCDGLDNDCDGAIDEGWDQDGDGVSLCGFDCDDQDPQRSALAQERACDGIDNDCDGIIVEEGCAPREAAAIRPFGCVTAPGSEAGAAWALLGILALARSRRLADKHGDGVESRASGAP